LGDTTPQNVTVTASPDDASLTPGDACAHGSELLLYMLKINYLMLVNMLCEYHQYLAVPFPVDNCSSLMKNIK
jgi:hypothetical protein